MKKSEPIFWFVVLTVVFLPMLKLLNLTSIAMWSWTMVLAPICATAAIVGTIIGVQVFLGRR